MAAAAWTWKHSQSHFYPQRYGWAPLFSLRNDRFKFIDAPQPEMYDLQRDPFEQQNIFDERRELAAALRAQLRTLVDAEPETEANAAVDGALQARLAALGYTARNTSAITAAGLHLPDPKTCVGIFDSGRCK